MKTHFLLPNKFKAMGWIFIRALFYHFNIGFYF